MKVFKSEFTPAYIAELVPGKLIERKISYLNNVAELDEANSHSVCFYQNQAFYDKLLATKAGMIFVPEDFDQSLLPTANIYKVKHPYIYFMMLVQKWLALDEPLLKKERDTSLSIAKSAQIAEDTEIGYNTVVADGAKIGSGCRIGANCYIGANVEISSGCRLYPNVNIYEDCILGENVILHSGVVIGADGFGFLLHNGQQFKLPQVGNVIIGDNVEIGANSCVDRATLSSTIIGNNTKIDNLVQIGHNCQIGSNSIICAQSGLAGNTRIGDRVYLAGQTGTADHITIGDDVMVGAQSGVAGNVESGRRVFGYPARDAALTRRIMAAEKSLPELMKFYRKQLKEQKKDERK
jgi:UDP-3-O-[3-hydroxymyristoyl] glucosamine N-acyltransferase